jgi:hypothetical protein
MDNRIFIMLDVDKSDRIVNSIKTNDLEEYIKVYFKEKINL